MALNAGDNRLYWFTYTQAVNGSALVSNEKSFYVDLGEPITLSKVSYDETGEIA